MKSKRTENPVSNGQSMVLRRLALFELKKRRLLRELAELELCRRQVELEVTSRGIPIPWLIPTSLRHSVYAGLGR